MTQQYAVANDNAHSGLSQIFADTDRSQAFRKGRRHTYLVKFLRLFLPLSVIGLLGFTFSPLLIPKAALSCITKVKGKCVSTDAIIPVLTGPTVMKNPHYEGFDKKNGNYTIDAATAEINLTDQSRIPLTLLKVNVAHLDNSSTALTAKKGLFDRDKKTMLLSEQVSFHNSTGMSAFFKTALIDMTTKNISSTDPVRVEMPQGKITANAITIDGAKKHVTFKDNVQLYLIPPPSKNKSTQQNASENADAISPAKAKKQTGVMKGLTIDQSLPITSTTDHLTISDADKTAILTGNVVVKQGAYDLMTNKLQINYAMPPKKKAASTNTPDKSKTTAMMATPSGKVDSITAENGVVIYTADGRSIQGESADFNMAKNYVKVLSSPKNNMIITSTEGTITAKSLLMKMTKNIIIFDKDVIAQMGKNTLQADNLHINTKTNIVNLDKNVHITVFNNQAKKVKKKKKKKKTKNKKKSGMLPVSTAKMDPTKPIQIKANHLNLNDQKKIALFTGTVVARQDNFTLRADKLTAYYTGKMQPMSAAPTLKTKDKKKKKKSNAGQIKKIIAHKKVLMTSGEDQTVSGDKAVFNVVKNIATISGNVVLSQKGNILKGDILVLNLNTSHYTLKTKKTARKSRVQLLVTPENNKAFKMPR